MIQSLGPYGNTFISSYISAKGIESNTRKGELWNGFETKTSSLLMMRRQVCEALGNAEMKMNKWEWGTDRVLLRDRHSCRYMQLSVIQLSACYHGDFEKFHYMVMQDYYMTFLGLCNKATVHFCCMSFSDLSLSRKPSYRYMIRVSALILLGKKNTLVKHFLFSFSSGCCLSSLLWAISILAFWSTALIHGNYTFKIHATSWVIYTQSPITSIQVLPQLCNRWRRAEKGHTILRWTGSSRGARNVKWNRFV